MTANDRPTPRSTVIPRLPGPFADGPGKMRPPLETLIFHGAPPPPPPSPRRTPIAPLAPTPGALESCEDVLSAELLEDFEEDGASAPPPAYEDAESAKTDRPPPFSVPPAPRARGERRRAWPVVAAVGGAIALPVVLFAASFDRGPARVVRASPPRAGVLATAAPPPARRAPGTCALDGSARLLARRALVRGGVEATSLDERIAFAALTSAKSGTAFELDARTLAVTSSAKVVTGDPLRHVVPELGEEAPVEAQPDTSGLHTLADAEGESAAGAKDGFVVWGLRDGDGMVRLWRLGSRETVDAPRISALGAGGERVIAFRRPVGARALSGANAIYVGSFRGGQTTSELTRLSTAGVVGAPALDAHGDEAIVAWAQRDSVTSPWSIRWTRWSPHAGQSPLHQLALPRGGPGDRAMAPSISALAGGRVLLAWTEAGHGRNQVRAQVFDGADRPLGDPLAVSADDAVAGQEQIALTEGGRGAIAYLVAKRGSFELRATGIDCATP